MKVALEVYNKLALYKRKDILNFMDHDFAIHTRCQRMLERCLKYLGILHTDKTISTVKVIREELKRPGNLIGRRALHKHKKIFMI